MSVEEKVRFVSDLSGTTLVETATVGASVCLAILFRRALAVAGAPGASLLPDFAAVVLVPFAALLLDAHAYAFLAALTVASTAVVVFGAQHSEKQRAALVRDAFGGDKTSVISHFRAGLMLLTCFCILAVDFPVFPRRLAKVEVYGTGLMDVGPGAFVFMGGLVCTEPARQHKRSHSLRLDRGPLPLLLLGVARLLATTATGYQVHVGEYGAHWNFFVTLGAVAAATAALGRSPTWPAALSAPSAAYAHALAPAAVSVSILGFHQVALSCWGLGPWVARAERDMGSLVDANKEGIFSTVGYVGIHYAGVAAGRFLQTQSNAIAAAAAAQGRGGAGAARRSVWVALAQVWAVAGLLWVGVWVLEVLVEPVSRRSANAAYGLFITAYCLAAVAELMTVEVLAPGPRVRLLCAVNEWLLVTFLFANILTGTVNMTTDTLHTGDAAACAVLLLYMACVTALPVAASARRDAAAAGRGAAAAALSAQ